ncbi:hypothetical protein GC170_06265 [bacterium]|nr:hypothetical protein [bacterium]
MRSLRPAFIAVFLLIAAIQGTATAAHCRSEHVLVLEETHGKFQLGSYDPNRLSWEPGHDEGELAWGFSCQEGQSQTGRWFPGTHILAVGSTDTFFPATVAAAHALPVRFQLGSIRWAPDPRPPRSIRIFV